MNIAKYINEMVSVFRVLEGLVPAPKYFPEFSSYRYEEKSAQQAIIQMMARHISLLQASSILLENGYVQELGALQRMIDESHEKIEFLSYGIKFQNLDSKNHKKFLSHFYDPTGREVPHGEIRKYVENCKKKIFGENSQFIDEDFASASKILRQTYSSYVHGDSRSIMERVYRDPPIFQMGELKRSPVYKDHQKDFLNYIFRAISLFFIISRSIFGLEIEKMQELNLLRKEIEMHLCIPQGKKSEGIKDV